MQLKTEALPLVSVITPVYNGEAFLADSIQSILDQTYPNFELIIINDASTDSSLQIIRSFAEKDPRILVVENQKNLNVSISSNIGLDLARGEYVARMDQDDISLPCRLEKQVNFLQSNPQIGLVSGKALTIDSTGKEIPNNYSNIIEPGFIKWLLNFTCPINHPASMGRKELILKAGKYDPLINCAEDYDLWQRLSRITLLSNLRDILIKKRVHSKSIGSNQSKKMMNDHMLVQQRAFSCLLDRPVSLDEISALRSKVPGVSPRQSLGMLADAHHRFLAQNQFTRLEKRLVNQDYAFRVYRVANMYRHLPVLWPALIKSFLVNPSLFSRVTRSLSRRLHFVGEEAND